MFALQSQYDAFQLNCELGNVINPRPINEYAAYFRSTFFESYVSEGEYSDLHAAYLDSGLRHCGCWGSNSIEGMTSGQAQQAWYNNHSPNDKHIWDQNVRYPCLLSCCTYVGERVKHKETNRKKNIRLKKSEKKNWVILDNLLSQSPPFSMSL